MWMLFFFFGFDFPPPFVSEEGITVSSICKTSCMPCRVYLSLKMTIFVIFCFRTVNYFILLKDRRNSS